MNIRSTKKKYASNSILTTWLVLIIGLSACSGCSPKPESCFEYQVRVQAIDTGTNLSNAQVRIEVATQAPLSDITDADGTARIFIDSSIEGRPARLIVETLGYKNYVKNIDLREEILPTVIQLEPEQSHLTTTLPRTSTMSPTLMPGSSPTSPSPTCPWVPYLNGKSTRVLNDKSCLNDLLDIGISEDSKQISFFVGGQSSGAYGVCRDISDKNNLELLVDVQDTIIASRFLITIGPEPIPNKSAYVFRIQPQTVPKQQKEMYLKFIEYTSAGFDKELDEIKASPNWKYLNNWNFDFVFQFSGAKASAYINEMPSPYTWSMNPGTRYLCLTYEAMPTAIQSAQLEIHIEFP